MSKEFNNLMQNALNDKLDNQDELLYILGFSLMNYGYKAFESDRDIKNLKRYSHLIKSLKNKIKIVFRPSQTLKALAITERFLRESSKSNVEIDVFYCGIYVITSVDKDNLNPILKSDISILNDYIAKYMLENDVNSFGFFTSNLLDYLEQNEHLITNAIKDNL